MWNVKKFSDDEWLLDYLNGALVGSVDLYPSGADVDGKTIIIHNGTANQTVTFTPAKSTNWSAAEIAAKINAHANLDNVAKIRVVKNQGAYVNFRQYLVIAGDPAHIIRSTGTANTDLGFSAAADTTQVIIAQAEINKLEHDDSNPLAKWIVVLNP